MGGRGIGKRDSIGFSDLIRHMVGFDRSLSDVSRMISNSRSYLSVMIHNGTIPRLSLFIDIANACGFRLLLVGRGEAVELTTANQYSPDGNMIVGLDVIAEKKWDVSDYGDDGSMLLQANSDMFPYWETDTETMARSRQQLEKKQDATD